MGIFETGSVFLQPFETSGKNRTVMVIDKMGKVVNGDHHNKTGFLFGFTGNKEQYGEKQKNVFWGVHVNPYMCLMGVNLAKVLNLRKVKH